MNEYNLEPGEYVLTQASPVRFGNTSSNEKLKEVVLSNRNLILVYSVKTGLFQSKSYVKRCPLSALLDAQGAPQVMATKFRNDYFLQAIFGTENITLYFPEAPKRLAQRWADNLANAATNNISEIRESSDLADEVGAVVDEAKEIFGSIFGVKGRSRQAKQRTMGNPQITTKCRGCHAPLAGRKGETATCAYCDTKQTL